MEIIKKTLDSLKGYEYNARTHSEEQIAEIMDSIEAYGFLDPIEVDAANVVISGHARLEAARRLGLLEVPTITHSHLDKTAQKAYILAANKLAMKAGWDYELLKHEFEDILGADFDPLLTGFTQDEIDAILNPEITPVYDNNEDDAGNVSEDVTTQRGDVWILGEHRLMCGDSTFVEDLDKLTNSAKVDLIFTDPPYGMSYGGGREKMARTDGTVRNFGTIMNDDKEGADLIEMIQTAISNAALFAKESAAAYICFTWRTYSEFYSAVTLAGLTVNSCIVWDKKSIGLGNANYRPQHEFIFYCKGDVWNGGKDQSDVWDLSRGNTGEYVHPTQKPVELIEKAISNSSKPTQLVLDVFGGSGSTLIACEKLNRKCRIMELDAKYCDVIIKRWQKFSGKKAVLESTGEIFNG